MDGGREKNACSKTGCFFPLPGFRAGGALDIVPGTMQMPTGPNLTRMEERKHSKVQRRGSTVGRERSVASARRLEA